MMAIATTRTLLPLDTFAKILGINPLHFNGIHLQSSDVPDQCSNPFVQYAYQDHDRVGREEIAQTIADAESQITNLLGFSPMADYLEAYQDFGDRYAPTYNTPVMRLPLGYVIEGGVQKKDLIAALVPVNYTDVEPDDPDEDQGVYYETATIQVTIPVDTPLDELRVYYANYDGDDTYEIRPLTKVRLINPTTAEITVQTAQLVDTIRFMGLNFLPTDGANIINFADVVDVYRVYTDQTVQVTYDYAPRRCQEGLACQPTGRLYIRDGRLGLVYSAPSNWDSATLSWQEANWCACGFPMGAHVKYKAGLIGRAVLTWQRAITYYTLSLLDRPMCSCEAITAMTQHWSDDLAATDSRDGNTRTVTLAPGILNNPLGTTRAAIYVWRLIQRQQLGEAV